MLTDRRKSWKADQLDYDYIRGLEYGDDEICLALTKREAKAIISYIDSMAWRTRWYSLIGTVIDPVWISQFHAGIVNKLSEEIPCSITQPAEPSCIEIGAFHPSVEYWPDHPLLDSEPSPPFMHKTWSSGAGFINADGTDAMIQGANYLLNLGDYALELSPPYIILRFSGTGEVDLHFISQVQGGCVWVFPDGNPLVGSLVNLDYKDITDLAGWGTILDLFGLLIDGNQLFEVIHTMQFDTPGEHWITCWFFPAPPEAEPPFTGVGGGFSHAQYCGNITIDGGSVEDCLPLISVDDCQILTWNGNAWEDVEGAEFYRLDNVCNFVPTVEWRVPDGNHNVVQFRHATEDPALEVFRWRLTPSALQYILMQGRTAVFETEGARLSLTTNNRTLLSSHPNNGGLPSFFAQAPLHVWHRSTDGDPTVIFETRANNDYLLSLRNAYQTDVANIGRNGDISASIQLALQGRTSTNSLQQQARIAGEWSNSTQSTRRGAMHLEALDWSGAKRALSVGSDGQQAVFSVGANTPIRLHQPVNSGAMSAVMVRLLEVLSQFGFIGDGTVVTPDDTGTQTPGDDGDGKRCNVAAYLAEEVLPGLADDALFAIDTATEIFDLLSLLLALVVAGPLGAIIGPAISNFLTSLVTIDPTAAATEADSAYWSAVKCKIFCAIPANGILTASVLGEAALRVGEITGKGNINPVVDAILRSIRADAMGTLSAFGSLHDGDCAACAECETTPSDCDTYDFRVSDGGWVPVSLRANWVEDNGWEYGTGSETVITIRKNFDPPISPDWMRVYLSAPMSTGANSNRNAWQVRFYRFSEPTDQWFPVTVQDNTAISRQWSNIGDEITEVDRIEVSIEAHDAGHPDWPGYIQAVEIFCEGVE